MREPISLILFNVLVSLLSFSFSFTFSYIFSACAFKFASGINLSCFLSVIGTEEHEGRPNETQPHPNKYMKFLVYHCNNFCGLFKL